jgi:oligopeptidase B
MDAGHGGKSGRFDRYRSIAEYYAFMLSQLGATGQSALPAVTAPPSGRGERG